MDGDRALQLAVLRASVGGRHFLRKLPKSLVKEEVAPEEEYPGIDADNDELDFAAFDSDAQPTNELQLINTWEDERWVREIDIEFRVNRVNAPPVVARGQGAIHFRCFSCGETGGFGVQLPLNVFATAYRAANGKIATECMVEMANKLIKGEFADVYERTTCCKKLPCLLGQDLMSADDYCTWAKAPRPQLERGTDRRHQSRIFSENLVLLRVLTRKLVPKQLRALFEFLVLNSQFIQVLHTLHALLTTTTCMHYYMHALLRSARSDLLPRRWRLLRIRSYFCTSLAIRRAWSRRWRRSRATTPRA